MKTLFLVLLSWFCITLYSQNNKTIQPSDYFIWKSLDRSQISDSGKVIVYTQSQLRANSEVKIYNAINKNTHSFKRAKNPEIHPNEDAVVFLITPDYDSIRNLKLNKIPEKKFPKDSLGIYLISNDTLIKFSKISSIKLPKEASHIDNNWIAFLHSDDYKAKKLLTTPKNIELSNTKKRFKKNCWFKKPLTPQTQTLIGKPKGSVLTFYNTKNQYYFQLEGVKEYHISEYGAFGVYIQQKKYADTIDSSYLMRYEFSTKSNQIITALKGEITTVSLSKDGNQLVFMHSADTGNAKNYNLLYWSSTQTTPQLLVGDTHEILKPYQNVSKHYIPNISDNGKQVFFGIGNKNITAEKDTLTPDEKHTLDIWHWNEGKIQPQQIKNKSKDKNGSSIWMYQIDPKSFIAITDTSENLMILPNKKNNTYALVQSQLPYLKEMTWDYWYYDYYTVNLETGARSTLLQHYHGNNVLLSPNGNYFHYWNHEDSSWLFINTQTNETKNLTKKLSEKFYSWHFDVPNKIEPEGKVYWIEGDTTFLIESQFDIWKFDLSGTAHQITNGKNQNTQFSVQKTDLKNGYLNSKELYLKSFNHKTKNEGLWLYDNTKISQIFDESFSITSIQKAYKTDAFIIRQSSVSSYPELQYSNNKLETREVISNTNPQQSDYNWATVELISWKDFKGDSVSGLLYKPTNFDPNQKYPMIVYFYERYTQNFHRHYTPRPTASIIFPTEYASNGYIIFVPDIKYEIGKPAQSAYNAIVSGTNYLTHNHQYIDSKNIGLQGQSWGGYQTAQLITMTTQYKCAMAGAPVSNMFSAYGGIRWGSGLSRAFQYETGQSRIGKTIWEAPELYIENSPLFHLPKVQTPLLIMHNDGDGAVPWYQSIELYNGLRRLQKPVWLLNYNDDDHNLMKTANRIDLSIRMKSFFDHYLMNAPAPVWLEKGIPAQQK